MNNFEVRVASKRVTAIGFFGVIILCAIIYYFGSHIKYSTQQTYMIIAVLSIYIVIMYRINLSKSRILTFNINHDHIVIRENGEVTQEVNSVVSYYYKNIIPKKIGFLLQLKAGEDSYTYYIVSKDMAVYKKSDSDNIDKLSDCLDTIFKRKKKRDVIIDLIAYFPLLLLLTSIVIVTISVLYIINK